MTKSLMESDVVYNGKKWKRLEGRWLGYTRKVSRVEWRGEQQTWNDQEGKVTKQGKVRGTMKKGRHKSKLEWWEDIGRENKARGEMERGRDGNGRKEKWSIESRRTEKLKLNWKNKK